MTETISAAEYQNMINGKSKPKSKFRNVKTEVDGKIRICIKPMRLILNT